MNEIQHDGYLHTLLLGERFDSIQLMNLSIHQHHPLSLILGVSESGFSEGTTNHCLGVLAYTSPHPLVMDSWSLWGVPLVPDNGTLTKN